MSEQRWASDTSEAPYTYARERHEAQNEAPRRNWPVNRVEEAEARGYVRGDD